MEYLVSLILSEPPTHLLNVGPVKGNVLSKQEMKKRRKMELMKKVVNKLEGNGNKAEVGKGNQNDKNEQENEESEFEEQHEEGAEESEYTGENMEDIQKDVNEKDKNKKKQKFDENKEITLEKEKEQNQAKVSIL